MVNMFKALEAKKPLVVTAEWIAMLNFDPQHSWAVVAKPAG